MMSTQVVGRVEHGRSKQDGAVVSGRGDEPEQEDGEGQLQPVPLEQVEEVATVPRRYDFSGV